MTQELKVGERYLFRKKGRYVSGVVREMARANAICIEWEDYGISVWEKAEDIFGDLTKKPKYQLIEKLDREMKIMNTDWHVFEKSRKPHIEKNRALLDAIDVVRKTTSIPEDDRMYLISRIEELMSK